MLRKTVNYIMSVLLILSVIGISINKHYSGKKLYSVSIFVEPDSCCTETCNCCCEVNEILQITDAFLQSVFQFHPDLKITNLSTKYSYFIDNFTSNENTLISNKFFRYLIQLRENIPAQLQCFRL